MDSALKILADLKTGGPGLQKISDDFLVDLKEADLAQKAQLPPNSLRVSMQTQVSSLLNKNCMFLFQVILPSAEIG